MVNTVYVLKASCTYSNFVYKLGDNNLQIVNEYIIYLGLVFNEHLDIGKMALVLANSENRALGAIINKLNHLGGRDITTSNISCRLIGKYYSCRHQIAVEFLNQPKILSFML